MVRSTGTAAAIAAPPGIEIAAGDLDDNASLDRALRGIERAFLLTNSTDRAEARQIGFVAAAKRAGVRRIVKLSSDTLVRLDGACVIVALSNISRILDAHGDQLARIEAQLGVSTKEVRGLAREQAILGNRVENAFSRAWRDHNMGEIEDAKDAP